MNDEQTAPSSGNEKKIGSIGAVSMLSVLRLAAAYVLQMATARFFGAGATLDSYITAYGIAYFAYRIGSTVVSPILQPSISSLKNDDASGWRKISGMLNIFVSLAFASCIILLIFRRALVETTVPGLDDESISSASSLLAIAAFIAFFGVLGDIASALLKHFRLFAFSSASSLLQYAVTIAVLFAFASSWGVYALAAGVAAGFAFQFLAQAMALSRQNMRYHPFALPDASTVRRICRLSAPLLVSAFAICSIEIADRYFASYLDPGAISYLGYALRSLTAVLLLTSSVSTVYFTSFSQLSAEGKYDELAIHFNRSFNFSMVVSLPLILFIGFNAGEFFTLLLEGGRFTSRDSAAAAAVTALYCPSLFIWSLLGTCFNIFYARNNTILPVAANCLSAILNVLFNWLLVGRMGVNGIALASSMAYAVGFSFLLLSLSRRYGGAHFKGSGALFMKTLLFSAVAAGLAGIVSSGFSSLMPASKLALAISISVSTVVFGAVLAGLMKIWKSDESEEIFRRTGNAISSVRTWIVHAR